MLAIKNYGLLWERKYIFWGYSGVSGHLKGSLGKIEADFRAQTGVYILYDKNMSPVYVGQASGKKSLFGRLKDHTRNHLWNRWEYFSWFGLFEVNDDGTLSPTQNSKQTIYGPSETLNDIEGVLILGIEPKLNKQGPKFNGADQWWQKIDERVEDITNSHLLEKIADLEDQLYSLDV